MGCAVSPSSRAAGRTVAATEERQMRLRFPGISGVDRQGRSEATDTRGMWTVRCVVHEVSWRRTNDATGTDTLKISAGDDDARC